MRLRLAWATDPGLQRTENEDAVMVLNNRAGVDALLVVCDGMGGHAAGQLASTLATETFVQSLIEDGDLGPNPERLLAASVRANTAVHEAAQENPALSGMGSTLVCAAIDRGKMGLLNVGDSPAWIFRSGAAQLVSQDHSWPAEQVRLGIIKPEEARDHPMKHRLTRAIGVWDQIPAYTDVLALEEGDSVVLCSDGVETAGVSVEEMGRLLFDGADLDAGIKRVIERCRELGAPDNVTIAAASARSADSGAWRRSASWRGTSVPSHITMRPSTSTTCRRSRLTGVDRRR